MTSALSPETLFQSDDLRLVQSSEGYCLFYRGVLVFKSWPDPDLPQTSGLLFLREGLLFLRNASGEVSMPESRMTEAQKALLADLFLLSLPSEPSDANS